MSAALGVVVAYLPWIAWLGLMIWMGWRLPGWLGATDRPLRDAGRRFAFGAVAMTLVSLPVVYLIASLQASVFGGAGARWAEPQVLLATVVLIAPLIYVPVLTVRCGLLWLRERSAGE